MVELRKSREGIWHPGLTPNPGPVTDGTMLPEDLLEIFLSQLNAVTMSANCENIRRDALKARYAIIACGPNAQEYGQETLDRLWQAINNYAPEGLVFGPHPDDTACWGWWLV